MIQVSHEGIFSMLDEGAEKLVKSLQYAVQADLAPQSYDHAQQLSEHAMRLRDDAFLIARVLDHLIPSKVQPPETWMTEIQAKADKLINDQAHKEGAYIPYNMPRQYQ